MKLKSIYIVGHSYYVVDDADFKNDDEIMFNPQSRHLFNLFFSLWTKITVVQVGPTSKLVPSDRELNSASFDVCLVVSSHKLDEKSTF